VIRLSDDAPTGRGHQGQIESSIPWQGFSISQMLAPITASGAIVLEKCGARRAISPLDVDEADSNPASPIK
jgi:hypothetical protein